MASSHYNSPQNIFPFSTGSFSLNQLGGCVTTIFFVIAPPLHRSGITALRLTNSGFLLAFGSSRSKCVIIPNHRSWSFEGCVGFPFSLFYFFAYLGVFIYFIFQKKGIVLLLGSGFWGTLCVWGDYWGVYFICSLWKCLTWHFLRGIWVKEKFMVCIFFLSSKYFISLVFTRYLGGKFCQLTFSSFIATYLLSFPHMVGFRWPIMVYMDGFLCQNIWGCMQVYGYWVGWAVWILNCN